MAKNQVQVASTAEVESHVSPTNEAECSPFGTQWQKPYLRFCDCLRKRGRLQIW
jgi:hypothetical protein